MTYNAEAAMVTSFVIRACMVPDTVKFLDQCGQIEAPKQRN